MTVIRRYNHQTGRCYTPGPDDAPAAKRADLPTPNVISDTMEHTLNHADGKHYDSKSRFTKAVKDAGCEIVGNDTRIESPNKGPYKAEGVAQSIKDAYDQVVGT